MTAPATHVRAEALARRDALAARYPQSFHTPLARRAAAIALPAGLAVLLVFGLWWADFSPLRVWNGLGRLGLMIGQMFPPEYGTTGKLLVYLKALAETVAIAFLGTLLAAIVSFPLGFLAARNVVANAVLRFVTRRGLDSIRGVDTLIWALIWINVVGLGPFAGVLAVMTSDIGSFGKLFSEAVENADRRAGEGVASTGGGRLHAVRFGLLPEVLPVMASQVRYYFESNTRSATIIGIVGAGGIGLHLSEQIRTLEYNHVSFLIILILVTVAAIDALSSRLRAGLIGGERQATA